MREGEGSLYTRQADLFGDRRGKACLASWERWRPAGISGAIGGTPAIVSSVAGRPGLRPSALRMRAKHLSLRTERAYLGWMRRYILFHGKRHPAEMGEVEINAFLTHLAVKR